MSYLIHSIHFREFLLVPRSFFCINEESMLVIHISKFQILWFVAELKNSFDLNTYTIYGTMAELLHAYPQDQRIYAERMYKQ